MRIEAVDFFYLMLSQIIGRPEVASLTLNPFVNVATCLVFMAAAGWISYRGMETTKAVQYVLVAIQTIALVAFGLAAFGHLARHTAFDPQPIRLDWFNPFLAPSSAAFASGVSLAIFMFFGWEVTLTMNEETRGARSTPGLAATPPSSSMVRQKRSESLVKRLASA